MFSLTGLIIFTCILLLTGILVKIFVSIKNKVLVFNPLTLLSGLTCLIIGLLLLYNYSYKLSNGLEKQQWPSVQGEILRVDVVGKRAFRPQIEYQYRVNGLMYKGQSDLRVPGFGGRINRLDAAEKLAKNYSAGKKISVYYNPKVVGESMLRASVSYTIYLALSCAVLLYSVGFIFIIYSITPKKEFNNN